MIDHDKCWQLVPPLLLRKLPRKKLLHKPYAIYQSTLKQKYFLSGEFQPCNHGYWSKLGGICQNGRLSGKKMFHPKKIHT